MMQSVMMLRMACQSPQLLRHSPVFALKGLQGYAMVRVIDSVYPIIMNAVA